MWQAKYTDGFRSFWGEALTDEPMLRVFKVSLCIEEQCVVLLVKLMGKLSSRDGQCVSVGEEG